MYELIQAGKNTYYIQCPSKIGIYIFDGSKACMIDSGNDKDAGKKALKIIESKNWTLEMIINTHSHADHIGGNQLLQQRTGCGIYTVKTDTGFTRHPLMEPAFLFGAYPPDILRHKMFMAKESHAEELTKEALPEGLTVIPLEGHTYSQIGLKTDDDVIFLADSLVGEDILNKYRISYMVDAGKYLETLREIREMKARLFVPSHAQSAENIAALAESNIENTIDVMEDLRLICQKAKGFDDIMEEVFDRYDLDFSPEQFFLNSCTVKAMISSMCDTRTMEMTAKRNRVFYVDRTE